jgi:hypothetical protein
MNLQKHLELLGMRVEDRVTGFKGVVTSVTFDLYGCIQGLVNPGVDKDGKFMENGWFDVNRLILLKKTPVMNQPNFEAASLAAAEKGPAEKPAYKN